MKPTPQEISEERRQELQALSIDEHPTVASKFRTVKNRRDLLSVLPAHFPRRAKCTL